MGKLAQLPFRIGRKYEIGHVVAQVSLNPWESPEDKVISQEFDVKNQDDLNKINHHWNQLRDSGGYTGAKLLPPYDITVDEKVKFYKEVKHGVSEILKRDDVLSDTKIEEYTTKIVKLLFDKGNQMKLNL